MIFVQILNWNGLEHSIKCLKSVLATSYPDLQIHLLDNGSVNNPISKLKKLFPQPQIRFHSSDTNLGFAAGHNFLLKRTITQASPQDHILFLNNDATLHPDFFKALNLNYHIIAPNISDSKGITLAKSGLAKNRTSTKEPLFAACGACMLYSVKALKHIHRTTGHYFDPDYFCYCEDLDLGWRARTLGYTPHYIPEAICHHQGQASTTKGFNKFIMFHTFRNSLYTLVKNAPTSQLLKQSPHILGMQLAIFCRYIFTRKASTLFRYHGSFLKNLPKTLKKRQNSLN